MYILICIMCTLYILYTIWSRTYYTSSSQLLENIYRSNAHLIEGFHDSHPITFLYTNIVYLCTLFHKYIVLQVHIDIVSYALLMQWTQQRHPTYIIIVIPYTDTRTTQQPYDAKRMRISVIFKRIVTKNTLRVQDVCCRCIIAVPAHVQQCNSSAAL